MVIDVFSRMIAGFYIGFENASYAAAMQALFMATTDKTSYCKELDFDIELENWPSIGLPDAILADRGEKARWKRLSTRCEADSEGVLSNNPIFSALS